MKYAIVNGEKTEATKGAMGTCPCCGSALIAKCGEERINHWAHKGKRTCDVWWENETEWHRSWKGHFPFEWQEVVQFDRDGEKHIADVKTEEGWVLEFQYSYLKPEERRARNAFYPNLVWIVNGLRRKNDLSKFQQVIKESTIILPAMPFIRRVNFPDESRLLKEWIDCGVPVFFDFQEDNESKASPLWFLLPKTSSDVAYLMPYSRKEFILFHKNKEFDALANEMVPKIRDLLIKNERNIRSSRSPLISRRGAYRKPRRRRF